MYFADHGLPHFHVITCTNARVSVSIDDLSIIAGAAKSRDIAEALEWARHHGRELGVLWRRFTEAE